MKNNKIFKALMVSMLTVALATAPVSAKTIEEMQADKNRTEGEVASLQQELSQTLTKISTLESDIAEKEKELEKAGEELEEAAARQSEQYESMKLRIKYMYEDGNTTLLQTLFSAENFTDLINKAEYVQDVHSYDRTKLTEYEETTARVEELKNSLEDEYGRMTEMQAELESEKNALNATLSSKKAEITKLDQSIQEAIAERQRAEEAARQEAARQEELARQIAQQQAANQNNQQQAPQQQAQQQAPQQQAPQQQASQQQAQKPASNTSSSTIVKPQGRDGAAVVAYARQYIGYPYVYGGNSLTGGIDCSGFTQQIYAKFGVSLPRTSGAQASCGYAIPLSEARAGDLLCYSGHVGIYNGTGGIVHASSPSVGITEFSNCRYRTLLCVRRVL